MLIRPGNNFSNVLSLQSVNGLDKLNGFSIAPVVQYCSVASERINGSLSRTITSY